MNAVSPESNWFHLTVTDHLLVRSPLLGVVGVEHLQPAHLTHVAVEIRTVVSIVTVSGGSIGTQLGEILESPAP